MDHWRMSATEYRAQFDAVVSFSNGGGLRADGTSDDERDTPPAAP